MLPYTHRFTPIVKKLNNKYFNETADGQGDLEKYFSAISTSRQSTLPLIETDEYYRGLGKEQQKKYMDLVNIHLRAILDGLRSGPLNRPEPSIEPSTIPAPTLAPEPRRNPHARPRVHVYVHETRHYHLWYDWGVWQPDYYYRSAPRDYHQYDDRNPTDNKNNNNAHNDNKKAEENEQLSAAMILLAALLAAAAIIATLYTTIEVGRAVDQLAHMEDIFGNMCKLVITAFGGFIGESYGVTMGLALFQAPVFGAIIGTLIVSGIAITAAKHLVEAVHASQNYDSAIDYDPRFCLSNYERDELHKKGYDLDAVSEALREIAMTYDTAHQEAWSLMFWSKENKQQAVMVDLMRELKQGFPAHQFTLNNKRFNLVAESQRQSMQFSDEPNPVMGIVLEDPLAVDGMPLGYRG